MSTVVRRNPLDYPCVHCGARARTETDEGEYCKRPSGHRLYGANFHTPRRRLAGHYETVILHDESACFLCGTELPDKDPIEAMSEVGGFHVVVDGVGHCGALCYPCYFPDGFWRTVEHKIREDQRHNASRNANEDQPTLFDVTTAVAAVGYRTSAQEKEDR